MRENGVQHESWGPFAEGKNDIFKNELLRSIGARHGKSIAQVIVRWLVQRGIVAIPKSVRKERMAENLAVFDFELSGEDMQAIVALDSKASSFFDHRDPKMGASPWRRARGPAVDARRERRRGHHGSTLLVGRVHARRPVAAPGDEVHDERDEDRAAGVLGRQPGPALVRVLVRAPARRVPPRREAGRAPVRLHGLAAAADDDRRDPGWRVGLARDRRLGQDRGVPAGDGSVRGAVRVRRVGDGGAEPGRRGRRVSLGRDPRAGADGGQAPRDREAERRDATARADLPAGRRRARPVRRERDHGSRGAARGRCLMGVEIEGEYVTLGRERLWATTADVNLEAGRAGQQTLFGQATNGRPDA